MNVAREYRMPLFIGAGALVLALILYAVLVAPQTSKLSSLHAQETQLQGQQTGLQIKLAALKTEKQNLGKSCAELEKIATQIPSVQSPTDVDAEESSFESQFNGLAEASGVSLTQFSGFTPASTRICRPGHDDGPEVPGRRGGRAHHPLRHRQLQPDVGVRERTGQLSPPVRDPVLQPDLRGARQLDQVPTGTSAVGRDFGHAHVETGAPVGGRNGHLAVGKPLHPGHRGFDLLHLDTERPRRMHQGHLVDPLGDAATG